MSNLLEIKSSYLILSYLIRCIKGRFISFVIGCQDNNNNKVILYSNEYYILYCEFIDRVCEKIINEIEK